MINGIISLAFYQTLSKKRCIANTTIFELFFMRRSICINNELEALLIFFFKSWEGVYYTFLMCVEVNEVFLL